MERVEASLARVRLAGTIEGCCLGMSDAGGQALRPNGWRHPETLRTCNVPLYEDGRLINTMGITLTT